MDFNLKAFIFILKTAVFVTIIGTDSVDDLILANGFSVESHKVITDDDYVLKIHRIPSATNFSKTILLMHGVACSAADYLVSGRNNSLGFVLADEGYDVWMGNSRGNKFSQHHRFLKSNEAEYWNFSWHEIGVFDLPAMIDYILSKTNRTALQYICHSQGCTSFFVMLSMRPEFNLKIISMHGMAPSVYFRHSSMVLQAIARNIDEIEITCAALNIYAIKQTLFGPDITPKIAQYCDISPNICKSLVFLIAGFIPNTLNNLTMNTILDNFPSDYSIKQLFHYLQLIKFRTFLQYDFKRIKNLQIYGKTEPPLYNLTNLSTKLQLIYATNDEFVQEMDVLYLISTINSINRNLIFDLIELKGWNHKDFLFGINAKNVIYARLIKALNKF